MQLAISEAIGTFALIFVGAGAIVMGATLLTSPGDPFDHGDLVAIALAHGLTIFAMVHAFGHISGGHFNPAVTLGLLVSKDIDTKNAILYWLSQLVGGAFGALAVVAVASGWADEALAATHVGLPVVGGGIAVWQAIMVEAILTFFLVIVVMGTIDSRSQARVGGLAIGLTVTLDILIGGPMTGAAMNPARWFGPALVDGYFAHFWVYLVGPLGGGALAGYVYHYFLKPRPAAPGHGA